MSDLHNVLKNGPSYSLEVGDIVLGLKALRQTGVKLFTLMKNSLAMIILLLEHQLSKEVRGCSHSRILVQFNEKLKLNHVA